MTLTRLLRASCCSLAAALLLAALAPAADAQSRLRIVGGLARIAQYEQFEKPFWTQQLPELTQGRVTAEIVPFDQAGIQAQEMLRLMQLGVVQFGTVLLSTASAQDPVLAAPDLAGLAGNADELARVIAVFRPQLARLLSERYGVRLLAIYAYPAQTVFCRDPLPSLQALAGRRVRTSSVSQSDLVEAFGGKPVQIPFADIVPSFKRGSVDCAITGTLSGHSLGLHEVTSHLNTQPINWGVSAFAANQAAWNALSPEAQRVLLRELPLLERSVLGSAVQQTEEGIACNTGRGACRAGPPGRMVAAQSSEDAARVRKHFNDAVLPRWLQRCGSECATLWQQTLGPALKSGAVRP